MNIDRLGRISFVSVNVTNQFHRTHTHKNISINRNVQIGKVRKMLLGELKSLISGYLLCIL